MSLQQKLFNVLVVGSMNSIVGIVVSILIDVSRFFKNSQAGITIPELQAPVVHRLASNRILISNSPTKSSQE